MTSSVIPGEPGSEAMLTHRSPGMTLLLFCFVLQACVSVEERQVTPGMFDIATPANHFINSEGRARVILDLRARDLCATGYSRLRESRIVDAKGLETMAWRIACAMP